MFLVPNIDPSGIPTFGPSIDPSGSPTYDETISLAVEGINIIYGNQADVCESIADALDGEAQYCSLDGPSSARRRLQSATLYVDVGVQNYS